ncbi:MAG: RNA 2',3'-cyclic phosphodiesterase, partial [Gammaproteobacteria bacterium]
MRDKKDIRIFFALWPDPATRKQLVRRARLMPVERPARRVPDYNLHLTLHFIGNVAFDELACLQRQARQVSGKSFELVIDSHGH